MTWPKVTKNGIKENDRVKHKEHAHLNNGIVTGVSLSQKTAYVKWFDEKGEPFHAAGYAENKLEVIKGGIAL